MAYNDDINGCGGKGSKIRPPYSVFFKASCNKHDEGYCIGGTELDRWYIDNRFLLSMKYDIKRLNMMWVKERYYMCWAMLYYYAVRLFGKKYFNFKNQKTTTINSTVSTDTDYFASSPEGMGDKY